MLKNQRFGFNKKPYLRKACLKNKENLDFTNYPYCIKALECLEYVDFHPDVTFIIGSNGSGKSTVLEAIALAYGFGPEGGTLNVQFETSKTTSDLHQNIRLTKGVLPKDHYFLRAESFFNVATYMDSVGLLGGYGNKSLHENSHGESFMMLLRNKFKGEGLYLLDEPEAALSPNWQIEALIQMHALVCENSQFIVVTHSPILLSYPRAKILQFDGTGILEVKYEDTEHYSVYKDFLNNYQKWTKNFT